MDKTNLKPQRLESLDILRGFDLFCLVLVCNVAHSLGGPLDSNIYNSFLWHFTHVDWVGFSTWDLVMPLFMFMAGMSMPFSLSKYRNETNSKLPLYRRIGKRFLLLWLFGMMCQGNLLGLDPDRIYFFSNTLQSIALGYLVTALLYIHLPIKVLIGVAVGLLLAFWGAMEWITVDGYGGGNYTPDGNLAEWVDRVVLGRFRDGARVENGAVVFAADYRYTWIMSSGNFVVTVMTGLFAGLICRMNKTHLERVKLLVLIGVVLVVVGWTWHLAHPVIKKIWTSSMTLVSSGYCFLLMGLFYYIVDYKGWKKGLRWLKILGSNSITAYMIAMVVSFRGVVESILGGMAQYVGDFYPFVLECGQSVCLFLILRWMYKEKIFLKV